MFMTYGTAPSLQYLRKYSLGCRYQLVRAFREFSNALTGLIGKLTTMVTKHLLQLQAKQSFQAAQCFRHVRCCRWRRTFQFIVDHTQFIRSEQELLLPEVQADMSWGVPGV